ncbi:MAG TPA: twin-arginine translocase TatA/TatE family subunit [Acidimicrobiales bacterium]|nr:twin-arginine translocase TatA/TatE family subunit [Acidimicrobiales bacterium]
MLAELFGESGIIVLIVVVVLLFGGAAIPKLARSLGSAKTEFEKGLDDGKKSGATNPTAALTNGAADMPAPAPAPAPAPEESTPGS